MENKLDVSVILPIKSSLVRDFDEYFDKAINFRQYQYSLIKNKIKGNLAEVGPGNAILLKYYIKKTKKNLFI